MSEQAKFIYQFANNLLPPIFDSYMVRLAHNHITRYVSNLNFIRIRVRTNRAQNTLQCLGPRVWSKIPLDIKQACTFSLFKKKLKTHLLQSDVFSTPIT